MLVAVFGALWYRLLLKQQEVAGGGWLKQEDQPQTCLRAQPCLNEQLSVQGMGDSACFVLQCYLFFANFVARLVGCR
jgi:hypothetical protein